MRVVFVGHRGAGKSTLARTICERHDWVLTDLDEEIERRTGRTPAEIIAQSEAEFRELERKTFAELVDRPSAHDEIISVGGGFRGFVPGPVYVWIRRDGWADVAATERHRVWPELSLTEELARMRTEREPVWARTAHLVFDIPRARTVDRAARDLATKLEWLRELPLGWGAGRTWLVPPTRADLARAVADCAQFGLAGVEVRSDLFDEIPSSDVPLMVSLRGAQPEWLTSAGAHHIDIDVAYLSRVLDSGVLDQLEPRPLVLSSHPYAVDQEDVVRLVRSARFFQSRYPDWDDIELKFAPQPQSIFEAGAGLAMMRPLRKSGFSVTYLPQGREYAWLRPVLLHLLNARNYLALGISADKLPDAHKNVGAAWDLGDWLGHLVGPEPQQFDVLIGRSTESSQGDLWHRRAAIEADEPTDYLKVDVDYDELDSALSLFQGIGVRGVSVTSPHKVAVLSCEGVQVPPGLEAVNTLRRTEFGWVSTDTDTVGMVGALREIEASGVKPGPIAVLGSGGVSDAVIRGIEASPGWRLAMHVRARDGWPEDAGSVRLIVNAAGYFGYDAGNPPPAEAWLDLHYSRVLPAPGEFKQFIGDAFFEFQAREQRSFWNE